MFMSNFLLFAGDVCLVSFSSGTLQGKSGSGQSLAATTVGHMAL